MSFLKTPSASSARTPRARSLVACATTLLLMLGSPLPTHATDDQPGFASHNASPKTYDVYIVAGQSNADGRGFTADLTGDFAHYALPQEDVKLFYVNPSNSAEPISRFYNTGWVTMAPGFNIPPGFSGTLPSNRFGFDVSLAKDLAAHDTERNVAIIKVTRGGTSLRVDWSPTGGENFMWQGFVDAVPEALAALTADGSAVNLRGLFWHQGESDGSNPNFESDLAAFIATVRSFLGEPELPFVIGELERDHVTPPVRSRVYQLTAMAAVANADPHTIVVSSEGLLTTDGTHFTSEGFLIFGHRMATAFHDLLAGISFSVSYDANGASDGSEPVDPTVYNSQATATAAGPGDLVRSGFFFTGWNTAPDGSGTAIAAGADFLIDANITLYAQWADSLPPPPSDIQAPLALVHHIRGKAENETLRPLGYFTSTTPDSIGYTIGVSGAGGNREDRLLVFGYSLPTLPEGATLEGATFHFEITGARDSTGGANLPDLHVYLLNSADPSRTGTSFFYHGPSDPNPNVVRVGTTSVVITDSAQVNFPDGQQTRFFTLTGEALDLLRSFYNGPTPTRPTVFFRFSLSEDPAINQFRRYNITGAAASRSVLDLALSTPAETSSLFKAWAAGEGGEADLITFEGDTNNDGVANGVAWLLGAASPEENAAERLPAILPEGEAIIVTFTYLAPDRRGDATLRLQYSATLENDSWATVDIPDTSGVVDGVDFTVTPLPETGLYEIRASIPGMDDRAFVRLVGDYPNG